MRSLSRISTNFVYNAALTLSSYVINFVLFPYVSRVLGVSLLGKVGFVSETINYFSLFAMMGITTLGIREIAACGEDRERRSRVFSSLVVLLGISTGIVFLVYLVSLFSIGRFAEDRVMFLFGSGTLLFSSFMLEWFYQGMENFRYVTLRTIFVKILYTVAVFLFVKTSDDYVLYFILTVACVVVNALINIVLSKRFVRFSMDRVTLRPYIKPFLSLGVYKLMVSMYTTFNVVYLGFVCSETELGYYYSSNKLFYIILGVFSAFTAVMLPRMSSLLADKDEDEFKKKTAQSFELVFAVALPTLIYCMVMAPQIIRLMSGVGYEGAVMPMRIISPVLLFSAMAQIWVIQVLLPLREDRIVLLNSLIGAIVGLSANLLLVRRLGAVGSAWVLLLSELSGNVISFIYAMKKGYLSFPLRTFAVSLLGAVPYLFCCVFALAVTDSYLGRLVLSALLSGAYFIVLNVFVLRDTVIAVNVKRFLAWVRQ